VRAIIQIRALFSSKVLLPVMKDSAKNLGTREHQTMLEGWSSKLSLIVQHPSLISKSHLTLDAPKEEFLNEMKLELEGEAGRGLISENEILEKIGLKKEEAEKESETEMDILEFEGERDEKVEERNEIEKQLRRTGKGNNRGNFTLDLDLQRPGREKVGPTPELARRIDHHIQDAAKAFLFEQQKHRGTWRDQEIRFFLATSRAVERMFAQTKKILERNSQTRMDVIKYLVAMKDIPIQNLAKIWREYHGEEVRRRAKKEIREMAKNREGDEVYLDRLIGKVKEGNTRREKEQRKAKVEGILRGKKIIKGGEKYLKRHLEIAVGPEVVKKMKRSSLSDLEEALLSHSIACEAPSLKNLNG